MKYNEKEWADLLAKTDLPNQPCILKKLVRVRLVDLPRLPGLLGLRSGFCGTDVFQVKAALSAALEGEIMDIAETFETGELVEPEVEKWPSVLLEYAEVLEAAGYSSFAEIAGPDDLMVIDGVGPARSAALYQQAIGGS